MPKESPYFMVQSVDRAFSIIEVFIRKNKPLGIPEIAEEVQLHKSVVHRLLATMKAHQFLEQSSETGKYRIGPKAFEAGSIYMNSQLIIEGRRFLPGLTQETGELSHMAILNQGTLLYVINQGSPNSLLVHVPVGMRNPVHTTALGKVLLAWMKEEQAVELLNGQPLEPRTPKSIRTVEAFMAELPKVRIQGYALDDEETSLGSRCIAVPVRDYTGEVVAGISISGSIRTFDDARVEALAETLKHYGAAISERLGYSRR